MKKELYVIEGFYAGGIEVSLYNLLREYNFETHDVTVLSVVDGPLFEKFKELPIHVKCILEHNKEFRGQHWLVNLAIKYMPSKMLHRIIVGNTKYDTEVAYHNGQPAAIVSGAPKNCRKIAWFHMGFPSDATPRNIDNYLHNGTKSIIRYGKFDQLICVSHKQKESLIRLFQDAGGDFEKYITVRHNVVNKNRIRELSAEAIGLRYDGIVIVACGRLSKEKGFDRLVLLAQKLSEYSDDFEIWLIGSGNEKENIQQMARSGGVLDKIRFLGFQENPYKYISKADYVVCPSRYESYGLAVAEALVLGKNVIAARCEGTEELLIDVKGSYLIQNDDEIFAETAAQIIALQGGKE